MSEPEPHKFKTARERSFGADVDSGLSKEEIMKKRVLTPDQYEKALKSLKEIRAGKKQ